MWENPDHCRWWHPTPVLHGLCRFLPPHACFPFPQRWTITCKLKPFTPQSFSWSWCLSEQQEGKQKLGQACVPCKNTVLLGHLFTVLVLFFFFFCITGHSGLLHHGIFATPWAGLPLFSRKTLILPEIHCHVVPCTQLPLQYKQTSNSYPTFF